MELFRGSGQIQPAQHIPHDCAVQLRQVKCELVQIKHGGEIQTVRVKITRHIDIKCTLVNRERVLQRVLIDREQGFQVEAALPIIRPKGIAGQHVYIRPGKLLLNNGACCSLLDHMLCQGCGITDTRVQYGCYGVLPGLHNTDNRNILALADQLPHILLIAGFVLPHVVGIIILKVIRRVHQLEGDVKKLLIIIGPKVCGRFDVLLRYKLPDHFIQLQRIPQTHGIKRKIADAAAGGEHHYTLVIPLWPAARFDLILLLEQRCILRHGMKDVCVHHHGHKIVTAGGAADPKG